MSAAGTLLDRLAPGPPLGARAERARRWLDVHGLPRPRDEAWRYTPVDAIVAALDHAAPAPDASALLDRALVDQLAGDHGGPRLVFANGVLVAALSDVGAAAEGLWLGGAAQLADRARPAPPEVPDEPADGFHALNWAAGRDVAAVVVAPDADVEAPVHVVHLAVAGDGVGASHPRTVIRVAPGGRVQVVETHVDLGGTCVANASTRIVAGRAATVRHHRVVHGTADAIHVGRTGVEQADGSDVRATSIITGGGIARSGIDVRLGGEGARVELDGLHVPTGHERHDHAITVDHAASRCTSTQGFRGVVDGHGRGSFSGHVIVRPGTVGTEASQSNPNLVLRPTAQADTRPWLEILADDVRCTHGATVGRLDEDALFYLRSRGIPRAEARAMLVAAFAGEVVDAIAVPSLRDRVAAALAERALGSAR